MKISRLIFLLFIIGLVSCKKEDTETGPTACFTFTVFEGKVTFNSSCSEDAVLFEWDFGDNETSTLANPVHQYLTSASFL